MLKPVPKFRTRVSREGGVDARVAFNRSSPDAIDPHAYQQDAEASRLDRLDLESTTDGLIDATAAHSARLDAMGPLACVGYAHMSLDSGRAEVLASYNVRTVRVGADVEIDFDIAVGAPYTALARNQQTGSTAVYFTGPRERGTVTVSARTLADAAVDLSLGVHEFVLIARKLLTGAR